jgi:hypothetical protein
MRISTTVDAQLLRQARDAVAAPTDASLIDQALRALLAAHRSARHDAAYMAYDDHPLSEPDEWGDLATFRDAAAAS